jgi:hypothetical protein
MAHKYSHLLAFLLAHAMLYLDYGENTDRSLLERTSPASQQSVVQSKDSPDCKRVSAGVSVCGRDNKLERQSHGKTSEN